MGRGSRVGLAVIALPRSMAIAYSLSSADKTPLFSITWKGITVEKVQTPVSSLRRDLGFSRRPTQSRSLLLKSTSPFAF